MSKKIAVLFFCLIVSGMVLPAVSQAVAGVYQTTNRGQVCYEGFVPCGKEVFIGGNIVNGKCEGGNKEMVYCQFCHFFVMLNAIVRYILTYIIPPLAILFLIIGGVMFYFGGAKPDLIQKGKTILFSVAIGIFLVYGAYMIVGLFLNILGVVQWSGLANWANQGPFSIECPISL